MPSAPHEAPFETLADDDLMRGTREGRDAAFDTLVQRHQARVLRIAARYLGNTSLAPDVAQRSFVELYRSASRYEPDGKFWPYLSRIVLNQCRMTSRSEKRHIAACLGEADAASGGDEHAASERRRSLDIAIGTLKPKLRDVVVLRYVAELTLEEVGEQLDLPLGTVKSRLFSAMEKLRLALGEES